MDLLTAKLIKMPGFSQSFRPSVTKFFVPFLVHSRNAPSDFPSFPLTRTPIPQPAVASSFAINKNYQTTSRISSFASKYAFFAVAEFRKSQKDLKKRIKKESPKVNIRVNETRNDGDGTRFPPSRFSYRILDFHPPGFPTEFRISTLSIFQPNSGTV